MIYQITVRGRIDRRYLPVLGNVNLDETDSEDGTLSVITGEMQDQSALGGILNALIDHRYTLISVKKLND
jgi:hypothetical protein